MNDRYGMLLGRVSLLGLVLTLTLLVGCTPRIEQLPTPTPATQRTPTASASSAPPSACIDSVTISGGRLQPEKLTVRRNCAILFTNRDEAMAQIQGHDFLLGEMGKDQSWAHTYRDPGTFEFFNVKIPTQRGTITVLP